MYKNILDCSYSSLRISIYSFKKCNDVITTTISKDQPTITTNSRPYQSLRWMDTAQETNKVIRKRRCTKVGFLPLLMQTSHIHRAVSWCLPLTFFLWYKVGWKNWIFLINELILWYPITKWKKRIEDNEIKIISTKFRLWHKLDWTYNSIWIDKWTDQT